MLTPRQELILRKVVEAYAATGQPVGSKRSPPTPSSSAGPSTIRNELAMLEEHGLLAHPHTSAGRVPTDAGHRYVRRPPAAAARPRARPARDRSSCQLMRREVDEAMRVTTETLSQVTNLLAIVSAPPLDTATIRHVEVLLLQPQVADGRRHHLDRRRDQARLHVRPAGRPGPGRLGRRVTSTSA